MKDKKSVNVRGITLIALVVTIVVLLILAAVSISMLSGENGIIAQAKNAKEKTEEEGENEQNLLDKTGNSIDNYVSGAYDGWNSAKGVNQPSLSSRMVAVYWTDDGDEIYSKINEDGLPDPSGEVNPNFDWNLWYDYVAQTGTTDGTSKWANAISFDDNGTCYCVWIPRFAYKITSGLNSSSTGKVEIKFLKGTSNEDKDGNKISKEYPATNGNAMSDFVIHPSFVNGTANNFANGEWDSEIGGYWVAKYKVKKINQGENVSQISIPGSEILLYDANYYMEYDYATANYYNKSCNSHLMKNSEWGAIAYLTQSNYGRNGNKVSANNTYYSGGSRNATATTNVSQSSTGNPYGIFDLVGGGEFVAGYAGFLNEMTSGLDFAYTELPKITTGTYFRWGDDVLRNKMVNTKFITVYPCDKTNTETVYNYNIYANTKMFGDAILETTTVNNSDLNSWENISNIYFDFEKCYMIRGENGIFSYEAITNGGYGYRIVLM